MFFLKEKIIVFEVLFHYWCGCLYSIVELSRCLEFLNITPTVNKNNNFLFFPLHIFVFFFRNLGGNGTNQHTVSSKEMAVNCNLDLATNIDVSKHMYYELHFNFFFFLFLNFFQQKNKNTSQANPFCENGPTGDDYSIGITLKWFEFVLQLVIYHAIK